jgi:hypothetical protein
MMTGDSEMGEGSRGGACIGVGADSVLDTTDVWCAGVGMEAAFVTDGGELNAAGACACVGVGAGTCAGAGAGVNVDCAPFSRLTSFTAGVLPAKNSLAESVGSEEAAGG